MGISKESFTSWLVMRQADKTEDDRARNALNAATTWSSYHVLAIDSTRIASQSQTASLPIGQGACRVYSTGDTVDNTYRLLSLLGVGGMGVVFHCQHLILGKEYALKLLSSDNLSAEAWLRFQAEAKALARLHHTGVVGIHNMGIDKSECPYYVMDLLEGDSLAQTIQKQKRLEPERAIGIFLQVADALNAAHQQGIVHRDIKPSNIMVLSNKSRGEHIKLVDFGIARLSSRGYSKQFETVVGSVFGTPYYMSPEQGLGKVVDERSDVYSLGCALFEALTGVPPLCGDNAMETMMLHQSKEAPTLNQVYPKGMFSAGLESALAKMLQKDPAARYQSMQQLMHDLKRAQAGKSVGTTKRTAEAVDDQTVEIAQKFKDRLIEPLTSGKAVSDKSSVRSLAVVIGAFSLVISAGLAGFYMLMQSKPEAPESQVSKRSSEIVNFMGEDKLAKPIAAFKAHYNGNSSFCQHVANKNGEAVKRFVFPPESCHMGYLSYDGGPVQKAKGIVDVPEQGAVTLYLQCVCTPYTELSDKFADGDLTGLEIVTFKPDVVLPKLLQWKSLKHLSLFNSIERIEGIDCSTLARQDLPLLDKFTNLKTLGLCGELITGALKGDQELVGQNIVGMKLLTTIDNLMLKEIRYIEPLIADLYCHPNLKELTLDTLDITDEDIEALSKSQSLEKITIFHCPKITEKSAVSFSKMKNLKQLHMDQNWPDDVKKRFGSLVKGYAYENYKTNRHN